MQNIYSKKSRIVAVILLVVVVFALAYIRIHTNNAVARIDVDTHLSQGSDASFERSRSIVQVPLDLGAEANASRGVGKVCSVSLTMSADKSSTAPGDTVTYTMSIKNTSKVKCLNTSVSNYYSDNVSFVSSNPKPTASNYYWNISTLAPGASFPISFSTIIRTTATDSSFQTEACATADGSADSCKSLTTTIVATTAIAPTPTPALAPTSTLTSTPVVSSGKVYGSWIWVSPVDMTPTYTSTVLNTAVANGINTLYITVDDYLSLTTATDRQAFGDALEAFVKAANAKGIAVDAEAGWRDWAETSAAGKATAIVDYVKSYNATRTYKLHGFQYDVEPYLLPTYETDKATVLTHFVALIDQTVTQLRGSDLTFTVVIPHFYDDKQAWTSAFTYGGYTTYTFNHLLRILDTRLGSSMIIMAYRNTASGTDGSIQISQVEINEASAGTSPTQIVIAQETGNVDPAYVTFYGTSKAYYVQQIGIINSTFVTARNFGGLAVHYIDPFMLLR